MIIIPGLPVTPIMLDPATQPVSSLCCKPYPGHPRGCPNFNKKSGCPPSVKLWNEVFDTSQLTFAIINRFDFGAHVAKMKALHPKWSDRQAGCCLYWQAGARKELANGILKFYRNRTELHGLNYKAITCPEATGIDVGATVKQLGIDIWPIKEFTYQVALAGAIWLG
jgi:hypothetical protein